METLKAFFLNP
ncbi:hypothetical protein SAMN04487944_113134 [Gracilibacillus ureilyticus]|uniref:Uncharacterized protein n=1 Tax=Gracilibacillus ureilyticus TaxID=531814 RepID=A0A1H9TDI6_9BACI|nr:hypothetical protein SAMN04487944_113134 [Gracilibacillus ureilyticus]